MATYTSNYGWTKPSGSDNVDISVLNDNLDDQDSTIHDAFLNMAPPFSESSTYAVGDIVLYGTGLYKCHTAVVTPGSWTGSTNWQVHKLSEGGGGTTDYDNLTNHPSINDVELSGNKTGAQLGLQNTLTFDNVPTDGSNNPVKSGGVYASDEAIRRWTTAEAKSVSGNPITLTDGSARKAEGLVVTLEPKQSGSGTPSPTNVRPITGLTECVVDDHGANVIPMPTVTTIDSTKGGIRVQHTPGDDFYTYAGTASNTDINVWLMGTYNASVHALFLEKGTYYVKGVDLYDIAAGGTSFTKGREGGFYTLTDDRWINGVRAISAVVNTQYNDTIYPYIIKVEDTSVAPPYEPYIAKSSTITFGQTVYGGSVDFKTGSGETTYKSVTVTAFLGKDGSTHNNYYFSVSNAKLPSANTDIVDVSSNMFASGYSYEQMYRADTGGVSITKSGLCVVSFGADSEINTLELANAWLAENSLQVVYELATPIELTLTPAELELLKGYNYITTNGTTIALDYLPDSLLAEVENYVDAKIPPVPSSDGTYVLTCTVTDGTPAYSWESAT